MKRWLMGLPFDDCPTPIWEKKLSRMLSSPCPHKIYTPNAEIACRCLRDPGFLALIASADALAPDGDGILLGGKLAGTPFAFGKHAGVALGVRIARICEAQGCSLFLFGGRTGVAERAAARLTRRFPRLRIVGFANGYDFDSAAVAEQIRESGADALFVCLGSPMQELWIDTYAEACGVRLLIGLGGSLDVYAGLIRRAPMPFRRMHLEWLWRCAENPRRLTRLPAIAAYLLACRRGEKQK